MQILQKQHEQIANQRKDYINKIVAEIMNNNDFIAIEELTKTITWSKIITWRKAYWMVVGDISHANFRTKR